LARFAMSCMFTRPFVLGIFPPSSKASKAVCFRNQSTYLLYIDGDL